MEFLNQINFFVILGAALVWFGAQVVLSFLIRPYRRKLINGVRYIRQKHDLSKTESEILEHIEGTAFAVRSTIMLSFAYAIALVMPITALERNRDKSRVEAPFLWKDSRFDDIMSWYFMSIFAVNPLFGVVALVLRVIYRIKLSLLTRSVSDRGHLAALPSLDVAQRI